MVTAKIDPAAVVVSTGQGTIAQIAQLFWTDAKTLPKRMKSVAPTGTRNGFKVYDIAEAAAMIVKPGYEIEEFIRQMSPQELPPLLQKEFWNGQNARLKFEKDQGNLWPTDEIVGFVGELLNAIRMALLLVSDGVDREVGITDGQREIIRRIMDGAIEEMRNTVEDKFKEYHANRIPDGPTTGSAADLAAHAAVGYIPPTEDDSEEDYGI